MLQIWRLYKMRWFIYVYLLIGSGTLVTSLVTSGERCKGSTTGDELNLEENSAAYYFSRSETWDDWALADLQKVMDKNRTLRDIWNSTADRWEKKIPPQGLRKEHMIAVTVYTHNGPWQKTLNKEIREYGKITEYNSKFKLKSFHYLLTVALQALGDHSKQFNVYRGMRMPKSGIRGQGMRFGRFASASLNRTVAEKFGNRTLFVLNTTYGVEIQEYSFNTSHQEVLIPPYEKFEIVKAEGSGGNCIFTLRSRGYEGVEVGLERDGSDSLRVYRKTFPWWAWFLIALAILVILGGLGASLYKRCCQE